MAVDVRNHALAGKKMQVFYELIDKVSGKVAVNGVSDCEVKSAETQTVTFNASLPGVKNLHLFTGKSMITNINSQLENAIRITVIQCSDHPEVFYSNFRLRILNHMECITICAKVDHWAIIRNG